MKTWVVAFVVAVTGFAYAWWATVHRTQENSAATEEPFGGSLEFPGENADLVDHLGEVDEVDSEEEREMYADFINKADFAVDIYWLGNDGTSVFQGTLKAADTLKIKTFSGHKFFFSLVGSRKAIPHSTLRVRWGEYTYSFFRDEDGQLPLPSKWAPLVKEKLEKERAELQKVRKL